MRIGICRKELGKYWIFHCGSQFRVLFTPDLKSPKALRIFARITDTNPGGGTNTFGDDFRLLNPDRRGREGAFITFCGYSKTPCPFARTGGQFFGLFSPPPLPHHLHSPAWPAATYPPRFNP